MNTNRNPANSRTLATAVTVWLRTQYGNEATDQALKAALVEQGVLTPNEAKTADLLPDDKAVWVGYVVERSGYRCCLTVTQNGVVKAA